MNYNTTLFQLGFENVDKIINTIGRRWSLMIILELGRNSTLRNQDIRKKLEGISSSTLSELLKKLHKQNLIDRKVYGTIPPLKVEYSLTKNGRKLLDALEPVIKWASCLD